MSEGSRSLDHGPYQSNPLGILVRCQSSLQIVKEFHDMQIEVPVKQEQGIWTFEAVLY